MAIYEINTKPNEGSTPPPLEPVDPMLAVRRRQMVGIGVVLLLAVCGAAFGIWKWQENRELDEPLIDVPFGRRANPVVQAPRTGVREITPASYEIRTNDAVMLASKNESNEWRYTYRYQRTKYRTPDQSAILGAKYRTMLLKLTKEQQAQLAALPAFNTVMVIDPKERENVESLWLKYVAAADAKKPEIAKALTAAFETAANKSVEPTLVALDEHVARIKAILTPEQLQLLASPPRAAPAPPPVRMPSSRNAR